MTIQHVKLQESGHRVTWSDSTASSVPPGHRFNADIQDWIDAGNTVEPIQTEAEYRATLLPLIAATRYEHEVRGITYDTRYIATDRTSQSKLHAARTKGLEGIAPAAGWKCADANGNIVWWDCTAAEIVEAANAAFDYVDACFVREKELALSVADGTFTEADLETGWPA